MKSLIKKNQIAAGPCCPPKTETKVAQCCAKVSPTVAGCHD